ncbi:serine/threonine-protein kinase [Nocardioides sp. GXZ039]|uniref:serine/threonine-protein kinase n=1 Tax=Nocardioides sp. GXZ039 TaxID=3136018 RepID=UPI0030F3CBFE
MTTRPRSESAPTLRAVGPYTLLTKIGEGGMGVVYLASRDGHEGSGAPGSRVAVKVLRPHIVGDQEARHRLAREVSSLRRIRSRWVAEIVDADPWGEVPYVATRYVPGLSLHDEIAAEGPIEGADLLWFAGALAEGLASVHEVGVLHRDVKPSNVLMEGRTPILIDFGLARVADDPRLTHTGWLLGTPGYLAPEILYGENATVASDLHSWAATVAFAGTGAAPFGRGPAMAIMDRVRRGEHDLSGLTGPLRDVVEHALDPEPGRRPTLDAVLDWLRPQTTRPAPTLAAPPAPDPTPRPGGRGPGTAPRPVLAAVPPPPAPDDDDPFDAPLALAALAHGPAAEVAEAKAPTEATEVIEPERPDPDSDPDWDPTLLEPLFPAATTPQYWDPPAPAARPGQQRYVEPVVEPVPGPTHDPAAMAPLYLAPTPPQPASLAERTRRIGLVGAGSLLVGGLMAVAPWMTLAVVVILVWLLRSGSLAASAVDLRRGARGRKWYDGPQLVLSTPWHLIQSIPGAAMLVMWAGGLAVAAALICYAVGATVPTTLFVCGLVLAPSLWWGPGGSRLQGPLGRVIDPVSKGIGTWAAAIAIVLSLAGVAVLYADAKGPSWAPASGQPFGGR